MAPFIKTNFKQIKELNLNLKTLKLLKKNASNTLHYTDVGKSFLIRTQFAQELRPTINDWDFIKLNIFCTAKKKKKQSMR